LRLIDIGLLALSQFNRGIDMTKMIRYLYRFK
jgi:hypothetical protein